jgi:hypothetical protein
MLCSVSDYLELAHCAFTRSQPLDQQVALSVTDRVRLYRHFRRYRALRGHWLTDADGSTLHARVDAAHAVCDPGRMRRIRSHDNYAAATALRRRTGAAHCGTTRTPSSMQAAQKATQECELTHLWHPAANPCRNASTNVDNVIRSFIDLNGVLLTTQIGLSGYLNPRTR